MRKAFVLMCLIGGILACTKTVENQIPDDASMVFNIDILRTKADDDAWVKGDKIYVFVTDIGGKYVSMERRVFKERLCLP